MHDEPTLERLFGLLRRELGAAEVSVLPSQEAEASRDTVNFALAHGKVLVVRFSEPPSDPSAVTAQISELVKGFEGLLDKGDGSRPPPRDPYEILADVARLLREVVAQAGARDAVVIDALSPIVWACASGVYDVAEEPDVHLATVIPLRPVARADEHPATTEDEARKRARHALGELLAKARAMPEMAHVRRGTHVHAVLRTDASDLVVQSFASNYLVLVECEPPVDEIRVQRTLHGHLSTIKRLVVTMPPIEPPDPAPMAGAVRLRRPRR